MIQNRICRSCGRSFEGGPRAYYCAECRRERQRASWREHARKKRQGMVDRPLGSIDKCDRCGKEYIVVGSNQRFCEDCQIPHRLEYDYKRAKPKYEQNKHWYNPVRNERRRVNPIPCRICGTLFQPSGQQVVCGKEECKQENQRRVKQAYLMKKKTPSS